MNTSKLSLSIVSVIAAVGISDAFALRLQPGYAIAADCIDNASTAVHYGLNGQETATTLGADFANCAIASNIDLSFTPTSMSQNGQMVDGVRNGACWGGWSDGDTFSFDVNFEADATGFVTNFDFFEASAFNTPGAGYWFDVNVYDGAGNNIFASIGSANGANQILTDTNGSSVVNSGAWQNHSFDFYQNFGPTWPNSYAALDSSFNLANNKDFKFEVTYHTDNTVLTGTNATFGNFWGIDEIKVETACLDCIPEPSTALLSMLALGGLSLRRRR